MNQTNQINQIDQTNQLQFLHDPFGIASEFHVTLSTNWFSLFGAGCLDGAFPIGDSRAAGHVVEDYVCEKTGPLPACVILPSR